MYQVHNEQGSIQDLKTMQVFPPVKENREGRKYLAWLKEGNKPKPFVPTVLVVDENEEKIQAKMREMAIAECQKDGELAADYK